MQRGSLARLASDLARCAGDGLSQLEATGPAVRCKGYPEPHRPDPRPVPVRGSREPETNTRYLDENQNHAVQRPLSPRGHTRSSSARPPVLTHHRVCCRSPSPINPRRCSSSAAGGSLLRLTIAGVDRAGLLLVHPLQRSLPKDFHQPSCLAPSVRRGGSLAGVCPTSTSVFKHLPDTKQPVGANKGPLRSTLRSTLRVP